MNKSREDTDPYFYDPEAEKDMLAKRRAEAMRDDYDLDERMTAYWEMRAEIQAEDEHIASEEGKNG